MVRTNGRQPDPNTAYISSFLGAEEWQHADRSSPFHWESASGLRKTFEIECELVCGGLEWVIPQVAFPSGCVYFSLLEFPGCLKVPHTRWLKQWTSVLPQFWRLEVGGQGAQGPAPWEALRKGALQPLVVLGCGSTSPVLCGVSLCACLCLSLVYRGIPSLDLGLPL